VQVSSYLSSPRGQGTASSFYKPRGGGLQSCRTILSATYGGMAHSVMDLMVVLTNLAPVGVRGNSPFGRRPYADSRVQLTGGRRTHNNERGDVLLSWAPIVPGMELQWQGW
jgi:hypothetical protein